MDSPTRTVVGVVATAAMCYGDRNPHTFHRFSQRQVVVARRPAWLVVRAAQTIHAWTAQSVVFILTWLMGQRLSTGKVTCDIAVSSHPFFVQSPLLTGQTLSSSSFRLTDRQRNRQTDRQTDKQGQLHVFNSASVSDISLVKGLHISLYHLGRLSQCMVLLVAAAAVATDLQVA